VCLVLALAEQHDLGALVAAACVATAGGYPAPVTASSACVIGLGYVGLPLVVALAEAGVSVVGFDVNPERVAGLRAGRSGIEDVPDAAVATRGLSFSVRARARFIDRAEGQRCR